jgi:hypothetical protein
VCNKDSNSRYPSDRKAILAASIAPRFRDEAFAISGSFGVYSSPQTFSPHAKSKSSAKDQAICLAS